MGFGIFQKIVKNHLVEGKMALGENVNVKVDQTLIQVSEYINISLKV